MIYLCTPRALGSQVAGWCLAVVWLTATVRPGLAEPPALTDCSVSAHALAGAEDAWPVARAPATDVEPVPPMPQLLAALPEELLRDYPATYLVYREEHTLRPDGNEVTRVHQLLRLNNRLALEELAEQQIEFLPASQTLVLHTARLHTAGGAQVDLLPHQAHVRDTNTDFKVYDQARQLVLSFPARTPGDVLEFHYSVIDANPQAGGHMFDIHLFGHQNYPVGLEELVLRLPADRTLRYAMRGTEEGPAIECSGSEAVYRWRRHAIFPPGEEERMPPAASLLPCVAYSTFASWEEVAAFHRRVREGVAGLTPELQTLVAELAPPDAPPLVKLQRLAAWVRDHIRYLSAHHEPQGYSPHPPAKVCADGYGDCKDKCQLLFAMLRHAGLPAALAFLNTDEQPQLFDEVPSPGVDHVLVLVELEGQQHWIDPTGSLGAWNVLSPSVCGRRTAVWDGQHIRLLTTPALRPEQNRVEQQSELVLDPAGTGRWKLHRASWGQEAWTARETLLAQSAQQRRQALAAEFQGVYGTARLLEFALDEPALSDPDQPLRLQAEFEIPEIAAGDGVWYLPVANALSHGLLSDDVSRARRWPYLFDWPLEIRHRVSVRLPVNYVLEGLPEAAEVRSKWGSCALAVSSSWGPRRVELEWRLRLEQVRVEPDEVPLLLDFVQQASELAMSYVELIPTSNPEDVPALLEAFAGNEADAATARVLAGLLIEQGQLEQAREILGRALSASPDQAALWELSLMCVETQAEQVEVLRELVARWPEKGDYLLQLALALEASGKTDEATQLLQRLAALEDPDGQIEAHYQLARLHAAAGQLDQAQDELAAARAVSTERYRRHAQALLLEAELALRAHRPQAALDAIHLALADDPDHRAARLRLAQAWHALGKAQSAWRHLQRYVSQEDDHVERLTEAAELALALGRRGAALQAATRALELMPDSAPAQRLLVRTYHALGRPEQAVAALGEGNVLGDAATASAFLESALRAGRLSDALQRLAEIEGSSLAAASPEQRAELERLLADVAYCGRRYHALVRQSGAKGRQPTQAHALQALACAEWLAGQGDWARVETLAARARAARLRPASLDALSGLVLLHTGHVRAARERAAQHRQRIDEPMTCFLRGRLRYELHEAGAVADLRRAAELTEHRAPLILHALATALAAEGERKQALELARRAVALAPRHRALRAYLEKLDAAASEER